MTPLNEIPITQTLIKQFEKPNNCFRKVYECSVLRIHDTESIAMLNGCYFETLCLGAGSGGKQVLDLPRKKNGEKKIDQERIEFQAAQFEYYLRKWGIKKPSDKGKQIEIKTVYKGFLVKIVIDFVSSIDNEELGKYPVAIFDTKLTKNMHNEFGGFSWGAPENMDHLQGMFYPVVFATYYKDHLPKDYVVPFYNLVFDYKTTPEAKVVPVLFDAMYEDRLLERITFCNEKLEYAIKEDWPTVPDYDNCKNCPLLKNGSCKDAPNINFEKEDTNGKDQDSDSVFQSLGW